MRKKVEAANENVTLLEEKLQFETAARQKTVRVLVEHLLN
jgi:hypothetical protein